MQAPDGWKSVPFDGGQAFEATGSPAGTRFEVAIGPIVALSEADLSAWLTRWSKPEVRDVAGRRCDPVKADDDGVRIVCSGRSPSGGEAAILYTAPPPMGGRTRGIRVTFYGDGSALASAKPGEESILSQAVSELASASGDREPAQAAAAAAPSATPAPKPKPTPTPAFQAAPGKGLRAAEVVGFGQHLENHGYQYDALSEGFEMKWTINDYLLLANGKVYDGWPQVPAEDFDAAASQKAEPKSWGTWTTGGKAGAAGDYVLRFPGGRKETTNLNFLPLAKPGETLSGTFVAANTLSLPGITGTAWKAYVFRNDGSFELSQGGSTDSDTGEGTVSTTEHGSTQGRYALSGNLLELRFGDGHVSRLSFQFFTDKKDTIVVGGQRLSKR